METIILKGITQKGKNRIKEHGSEWVVIQTKNEQCLLKAKATGYLKWGPSPDFKKVNN